MVPGPEQPDLAESGVDAWPSGTSNPDMVEGGDNRVAGRAAGLRLVPPTILRVETLARLEL
jgi:hypothetical protein